MKTRTIVRNHKTYLGARREANRINRAGGRAAVCGPYSDNGWVVAVTFAKAS